MRSTKKVFLLHFVFCFVVFIASMTASFAVEIKTTVNRNPIGINESFQLVFTATESPDEDPDFSPLKKDFEILNQSKNSNSSWINGQSNRSIQWILNIMAKKTGDFVIPPISFGDDRSLSATISVIKQPIANKNHNEDLFLDVEVSPKTVYVQSQVIYTLRLYRRVQITQASLNEPIMLDAVIEKLGEDKNYSTHLNGVEYVVTERQYAIFPQKSGAATIEPLVLTAEIVSGNRSRFNGVFNRRSTVTKRVSSEAVSLDVKAAPSSFTGKYWIPAEHVYIEEKWSGDPEKMTVGEPLTRTLTLLAKGTTVAQLPVLHKVPGTDQLKTYPDQAVLKEKKQSDGVIAFREEKIAYIPSKAGVYVLPAIDILWFNTQTQQMESVHVAEKKVLAIASSLNQTKDEEIHTDAARAANKNDPVPVVVNNSFWMGLSAILAMAWLITLFLWLKKPGIKQSSSPIKEDNKELKLKEIINVLKQSCHNNDADAAKNALLNWGKIKFNSDNLANIAGHCEARLRDEINLLNQHLYSSKNDPWQGKKLFQFFTENNARAKIAKKENLVLQPLYKM